MNDNIYIVADINNMFNTTGEYFTCYENADKSREYNYIMDEHPYADYRVFELSNGDGIDYDSKLKEYAKLVREEQEFGESLKFEFDKVIKDMKDAVRSGNEN